MITVTGPCRGQGRRTENPGGSLLRSHQDSLILVDTHPNRPQVGLVPARSHAEFAFSARPGPGPSGSLSLFPILLSVLPASAAKSTG